MPDDGMVVWWYGGRAVGRYDGDGQTEGVGTSGRSGEEGK